MLDWAGRALATYLSARRVGPSVTVPTRPDLLLSAIQPGDVLLVEGRSRISGAIKYLTQSTWSHAALFVGRNHLQGKAPPDHLFVEADLVAGVRTVGLGEFAGLATRICRPVGLSSVDIEAVTAFAINRVGHRYDLRNVIDLARYLLPNPPVPMRFRRRMIALGSGDPTRAICSTLIAQAFQSVRYPILPKVSATQTEGPLTENGMEEVLQIRHHSLFAPRDFDLSPYFNVIKPTLEAGFDPYQIRWSDRSHTEPGLRTGPH